MKAAKLFTEFIESERSGGLVLIVCTIISLVAANSGFGEEYINFWHIPVFGSTVEHWINNGLMAIFFLLIGLELEREVYEGELSNIKTTLVPVFAAIGGIIVPASCFLMLNFGTDTQSGAGIPMATDIAFALGILSLLGSRVPVQLKVFLTALAVIDDLGAIIIIAVFYTDTIIWMNLCISLGFFILLLLFNRFKVKWLFPYLIGGVFMWFFMLHSGLHATISGVLLAFVIPFKKPAEKGKSLSDVLQHALHVPVAFIVLPIFALANTAIVLNSSLGTVLSQNYSIGIAAGLILGKPVGIVLFTFLALKFKLCRFPEELSWKSIIGAGFLGGIGFTMSIFIALLAFKDQEIINNSKLVILISSLIAGSIGFLILKSTLAKPIKNVKGL